jgi:hypothetical protein
MSGTTLVGSVVAGLVAALVPAQPATPDRAVLCASVDQPAAEAARVLEPLGEAGRAALLRLARSAQADEAACGVAGLAALRDRRVVAPVRAALVNPGLRDEAYRFARWAAYVAGGPAADLGAAFLPLVEALADPASWAAAGTDAVRLLGEIDHPAARDRLVAELGRPHPGATVDALIHALARQGEVRARERASALGLEAVAARSGNLTYEQASRIGAVTFYLFALGPDTMADGLQMLRHLAPGDQEDAAAWAVQTWCERATRRPSDRDGALRARAALVAEFARLDVRWSHLVRGAFTCAPAEGAAARQAIGRR